MQGDTSLVFQLDLCLQGLAGMNKGLSHEENETFLSLKGSSSVKHLNICSGLSLFRITIKQAWRAQSSSQLHGTQVCECSPKQALVCKHHQ